MNSIRYVCAALCAVVLVCAVVFIPLTGMSQNVSPSSSPSTSSGYVVRAYGNQLAIFSQSSDEPLEVLPITITDFPADDQKLLKQGIAAADRAEVQRILEDYSE